MSLEFVSFDPMQGAIFYILGEHRVERPRFERAETDCLQCHVAASTRGVPGVMVRSVFDEPFGNSGGWNSRVRYRAGKPSEGRWGGWYVTGLHGRQTHMGNATLPKGVPAEQLDRSSGANLRSLEGRLDTSGYLTSYSDIVARLVLAHQTQMHNLITEINYQTRLALYKASGQPGSVLSDATREELERQAEQLVRYLLFTNEARLEDPITGTSGFAAEFAARGPRDSRGRSLRDFDLRTRIFKYPCSYLIIPNRSTPYRSRLRAISTGVGLKILAGYDRSPRVCSPGDEDRRAILEILLETKPGLPEELGSNS